MNRVGPVHEELYPHILRYRAVRLLLNRLERRRDGEVYGDTLPESSAGTVTRGWTNTPSSSRGYHGIGYNVPQPDTAALHGLAVPVLR